jgi:glycosyltransferase involved in cell wall biosynthesis
LLHAVLGSYEPLTRSAASGPFIEWARAAEVDVIYGRYGDIVSARLLLQVHEALGVPLVLHAMDDWPENMYLSGPLSGWTRTAWSRLDRAVVAKASVAIGICDEMSRAYEERYGRHWESLPMPVDWPVWQRHARKAWAPQRPLRIRYGGRVGWSIRNSIIAVGHVVHELCREGEEFEFDVRTFQAEEVARQLGGLRGVHLRQPEPFDQLPASQAAADVLLICYDFGLESFHKARYSMPGKMAECMASGTPCLVYGPAGLPVVEYARREEWALVVDDPSPRALRGAMLRLRNDPGLRERLGRRALQLASTRHDARRVAAAFSSLLGAARGCL